MIQALMIVTNNRITPQFFYTNGHPAGYTDDLGIISDENRYVKEEIAGYESMIDSREYKDILAWCETNFSDDDYILTMYNIKFFDNMHVAWFMLRWG